MTENEMVGWHHRLNGHEFEQAPGVGDRQRTGTGADWNWNSLELVCCCPLGHKELDMTERLN